MVASGGKPPFLTCQLAGVERDRPTPACSQVGKGGLSPLTLQLNLLSLSAILRARGERRCALGASEPADINNLSAEESVMFLRRPAFAFVSAASILLLLA